MTVLPPKKTKDEKADETPESSEAGKTMENAQEKSVDYSKFYSKFNPRALNVIMDEFEGIQDVLDNFSMGMEMDRIRQLAEYVDDLQKMFTVMQQIEDLTSKRMASDEQ